MLECFHMQTNITNAFLAYSEALNLTYDSKADYENRVTLFQGSLFQIAQINAKAQTYYVRRGWRAHSGAMYIICMPNHTKLLRDAPSDILPGWLSLSEGGSA